MTNVGYAHIEFFDSVDGTAPRLSGNWWKLWDDRGTAVLNADDPRVAEFARAHKGRTISIRPDSLAAEAGARRRTSSIRVAIERRACASA